MGIEDVKDNTIEDTTVEGKKMLILNQLLDMMSQKLDSMSPTELLNFYCVLNGIPNERSDHLS